MLVGRSLGLREGMHKGLDVLVIRVSVKALSVLGVFMGGYGVTAQEPQTDNFPPPETPVTISAARASGTITVDGRLNEAAWDFAEPITDFFRVEPNKEGGLHGQRRYG